MAYVRDSAIGKVDPDDPSTESSDYVWMRPAWELIDDICAGLGAVKKRAEKYLPRFPKEGSKSYRFRLEMAPWRPEFTDALRNLCSKPFTKPVTVNEDAPDEIQGELDEATKRREGGFVDDVDGRGNSLHVFSRETFVNGVKRGLSAIYVTFPDAAPARTVAEEKASGVRPYWVQIEANNIIALYTVNVNGREVVEHIRFKECSIERVGFAEVVVERIRVVELNEAGQPTSATWRKDTETGRYVIERPAEVLTGVSEIPIALFFTGERSGNYRVKPPLFDLAVMQIELYCALSNEEQIITYAGSPMLKMVGMFPPAATPQLDPGQLPPPRDQNGNYLEPIDPPAPQQETGPGTIIYCPPSGTVEPDADYIQPAADNIRVIGERITKLTEDFRRLALQPTTSNSGNLTATGAAIEGAKSHSAIEVWANGLQDALNQALEYTTEWMKIADTVTVTVHTDFGVAIQGDAELKDLGDMQKRKVISAMTEREEKARRGVLGPNFDEDEEMKRLAEEADVVEDEQLIDPLTGQPIPPDNVIPMPQPKRKPDAVGAFKNRLKRG